uniref:RNA-directed RNA polymerase n=1 Tax=Velvet tobacco mottle virus TaxID=12473 RepID=F5B9B4_9VIRU|nr:RNA dependent RNA polymerase [Velvet tobacco mottle virus]
MGFNYVGVSSCKFREGSKHTTRGAIGSAEQVFPELKQYGWPERGSKAEFDSLLLQASRFRRTSCPEQTERKCEVLAEKYPKSRAHRCFRRENFCQRQLLREQIEATTTSPEINDKASPGSPWSRLEKTNGEFISRFKDLLIEAVLRRVLLLASTPTSEILCMSASDLVRASLVDPVRLFVKQEPHTKKKLNERRFRLISSVSIVDQIIERLLFGPQNRLEIALWHQIPSKPGMGLSARTQADLLWNELFAKSEIAPAAEADISGFDWSVQEWELWADLSMRISLCEDMHDGLRRLMVNRYRCFMLSCFQLSNGELYEQVEPGLMKSGSYCTSSSNSRIRCLMGYLIGAPWIIAMGDDSVEGYVRDAKSKYEELGHTCKEYELCDVDSDGALRSVNFCSHLISRNKFWLTSWPKTLYRFLDSPSENFHDLERELGSCPKWAKIKDYCCQVGLVPDKTYWEEDHPADYVEETHQEPGQADDTGNLAERADFCSVPTTETPKVDAARAEFYSYGPNGWSCDIPEATHVNQWPLWGYSSSFRGGFSSPIRDY